MSRHNGSNVRVSVDDLSMSAQRQSKDKICFLLWRMFKRLHEDCGIPQALKEKECYIGKSEKRRRKKHRSKMARLKSANEVLSPTTRYGAKEWDNE
jgi:ribosomal protein S21